MGCDIHGVIQVKENGKWVTKKDLSDIIPGRPYETFGLLAGVRGNIDPLKPTSGIPSDIIGKAVSTPYGEYTEYVVDGIDLGEHSFTSYTLEELRELYVERQPSLVKEYILKKTDFLDYLTHGNVDEYSIDYEVTPYITVCERKAIKLIDKGRTNDFSHVYVVQETNTDIIDIIYYMESITADDNDTRIVIGFDS